MTNEPSSSLPPSSFLGRVLSLIESMSVSPSSLYNPCLRKAGSGETLTKSISGGSFFEFTLIAQWDRQVSRSPSITQGILSDGGPSPRRMLLPPQQPCQRNQTTSFTGTQAPCIAFSSSESGFSFGNGAGANANDSTAKNGRTRRMGGLLVGRLGSLPRRGK